MNIITVVPITRQKMPTSLTYFTTKEVPVGAVATVPVRSKSIQAIVTETREAEDLKAEIRRAPYEIKKLGKIRAGAFFTAGFIDSCRELADFYATNMGALMSSIISEHVLENSHRIAPPLPIQASMLDSAPNPHETYAIQGDEGDRLSTWRSLIRQQFARKKSVAVYAPTIEDVRQVYESLEKGIEGYIFMLHGSLTKKKILDAWEKIASMRHPVVVVTTPVFSVLPRGDIETIVIERENGRGWMSMRAPFIDYRKVIENIARKDRKSVYLSDTILRSETLHRIDDHEILPGNPFKWRSISTAVDTLVDMRRKPDALKESFKILSPELEDLIRTNKEENTHLFVMTSRRGLATLTVCDDCETIIACENCGTPLVLHTSKQTGAAFYMCHSCGTRTAAVDSCKNCGGHRLSPLGIGAERVKQEIKARFDDVEVFQVDADTTTTEKQVGDAIESWRDKPGSVLVGTETALHHLGGPVDHSAVASLDSLFAIPDFRIEERLMYLLLKLRAISTRSILVQTRRAEEKIFEYGLKGNLSDFYRTVLAERKKFDYPPYSLLIKITLEGKKDQIAKQMGELQAHLLPHEIEVFPAFTATGRGTSLIHGLIKIPAKNWPDTELINKLRVLPSEVSIKVNPESLL